MAVLVVLAALGIGVEDKLTPTSLSVPGTEAARGNAMLRQYFGDSAPFAILLQGPAKVLDRQGPKLIGVLRRDRRVTTLSPWDRGTGLSGLRPNRRTALILADFHVSPTDAIASVTPHLEQVLKENVSTPARARTAGVASITKAIDDESLEVAADGEKIVAPILLIVLLLVFRSPIAAAIPLVFGAITVIASRGLLSIIAGQVEVSGFAVSIASMIGLALGVDYALLIVSRFREELASGKAPAEAASKTRLTAGRTTVFAGSTLFLSILIAAFLVPGELLLSLCITVGTAVAIAVLGPWLIGPAILVLLGSNIDRWRIERRREVREAWWFTISAAALRRPAIATVTTGALLLTVAAPTVSLATGPLTIKQLPSDNPTRRNVEAIEAAVGGGWIAPSIVVLASDSGPITHPRQLASMRRWQTEVASNPSVEAVIGPGPVARRVEALRRTGRRFLAGNGSTGLTAKLDRAGQGLTRLRRGLGRAAEGAHVLTLGSARGELGAGLLARGLSRASSGGDRADRALERFSQGAHQVAGGQRSAMLGASLLSFSANEAEEELDGQLLPEARAVEESLRRGAHELPVAQRAATETVEKLETAWSELNSMGVGTSDPHYQALAAAVREALTAASGSDPSGVSHYAQGYNGLPAELADLQGQSSELNRQAQGLRAHLAGLRTNLASLRSLTTRLERGMETLQMGSSRLAGGSDRIQDAATRLGLGLTRLDDGASRLATGLSRLREGNSTLERGLSSAFQKVRPLTMGTRKIEVSLTNARRRLHLTSPGFFNSGYFVLSALDGARPQTRTKVGQVLALAKGGQAIQMLVIPHHGLESPSAIALNDRLQSRARALAQMTGTKAAVTGGIAETTTYDRVTTGRLPPLVLVITLLTFLAMIAILRALPLAAVAVVLNLAAIAAAFGVLRLLFFLPQGLPLGGTSDIDPIGAAGIFGVVFGLSIDYAVFLLMRMREGWEQGRDHAAAITYGLEHTGSVITGAATIMIVVFSYLATAPIANVAQFGVALTVAVALDATVIRLMLLPALMKLIGPRIWWLPPVLARCIPKLNVHGDGVHP